MSKEEETKMSHANKLWNTGVDLNGIPLPASSIDPNWKFIKGPGVGSLPQSVYVVANANPYFQTLDSCWVWADPAGIGIVGLVYVFRTKFYLEVDLKHHWVQINGRWGADNYGQITFDAAHLPPGSFTGTIALPPGQLVSNYKQIHDFSIVQAHPGSPSPLNLKVGWHSLEVSVWNEGPNDPTGHINPTGFNVSALDIVKH
jgi:hypothetical protein